MTGYVAKLNRLGEIGKVFSVFYLL